MERHRRKPTACLLACLLAAQPLLSVESGLISAVFADDKVQDESVLLASDFGADPSGTEDSTEAIINLFEAAKTRREETGKPVTVKFEQGEYQIYKDKASKRVYHTSNTNSTSYPEKTIGLLIEDQQDLTVDGGGALFMMNGDMMALAVVNSRNIQLNNFSWDFAVPTTTEMTILSMSKENGKDVTEFYIPDCYPYSISGNTIQWTGGLSPYSGTAYWTQTGIHSPSYAVSAKSSFGQYSRRYNTTSDNPFTGVESIVPVEGSGGSRIKFTYSSARPAMQQVGMTLELNSSAVRQTAGAFIWESENVNLNKVNVHYMHGFGFLLQMSKDVRFYDCAIEPRDHSGHVTSSYADGIHASGAAGELIIENCRFSDLHDDPINIHGTFTRVENRKDDHTLTLKYIHAQQGGFPQFHAGDKVQFFTRDTLESSDNEQVYTVAQVISNPGENGNDLKTMEIRFEETLPAFLSDKIGSEPKYVAENTTYTPEVTIRNNTFRDLAARAILCTTRKKTLIENNVFYNTSMATIFLSNDSNQWYESGPIRDMTIRGNTFYIKDTGERSWEYRSAIYVHPVTKNGGLPDYSNPIHKNLTIEDNTFYMDADTVVKAESVENLAIRNNTILRTRPDLAFSSSSEEITVEAGRSADPGISITGRTRNGTTENMYEFTKCKNVQISGNTYDDGQKLYAVYTSMPLSELSITSDQAAPAADRNSAAAKAYGNIFWYSSDPEVAFVDSQGKIQGRKAGTAIITASTLYNGSMICSDPVTVTVRESSPSLSGPKIRLEEGTVLENPAAQLAVESGESCTWSVACADGSSAAGKASINENGVLEISKNGIYRITASNSNGSDTKTVVYSSGKSEQITKGFSVHNKNEQTLSLGEREASVTLETGDLYQTNNSVKNLILYTPEEGFNSDSFKTAVRIENLPVRESGQWDTASFLLIKDMDNYISAGKKSHYDGIATVVEESASSIETAGNSDQNALSDAWIGFSKNGNSISVDFSVDGIAWNHVRDITTDLFENSAMQIGMAGWHTHNRGKSVTFKDFRISDSAQDYAALMQEDPIVFTGADNSAPVLSNVRLKTPAAQNGECEILFDYSDNEEDPLESVFVSWTLTKTDGSVRQAFTNGTKWTPDGAGTLEAVVYARDSAGLPSAPIKANLGTIAASSSGIHSIFVAGSEVWKSGDGNGSREILLPPSFDDAKVEVRAGSENWTVNNKASDCLFTLDLSKENTLRFADGVNEAVLTVRKADPSSCSFKDIQINGAAISNNTLIESEENKIHLHAAASQTASLYLYRDRRSVPIISKNAGEDLDETVDLMAGINTFLIEARAQDGISKTVQPVHIFYAPDTECSLSSLQLNGKTLDLNQASHSVTLDSVNDPLSLTAFSPDKSSLSMFVNNAAVPVENGKPVMVDGLNKGLNSIVLVSKAEDGINREITKISVYVCAPEQTGIESITINGKTEDPANLKEEQITSLDLANIAAKAWNEKSLVVIRSGNLVSASLGEAQLEAPISQNNRNASISVYSPNGKAVETKNLIFEKAEFLSDLSWDPSSVNGWQGHDLQKDLSVAQQPLTLCGSDQSGLTYERGIGAHANAEIVYTLPEGKYTQLDGYAGVDYLKHGSSYANIDFEIKADDETRFASGTMYGNTPQKEFSIDLNGVRQIRLIASQKNNQNWDAHADFALCKLSLAYQPDRLSGLNLEDYRKETALIPDCEFDLCNPADVQEWIDALNDASRLVNDSCSGLGTQEDLDKAVLRLSQARAVLEGQNSQYDLSLLGAALRCARKLDLNKYLPDGQSILAQAVEEAENIARTPDSQKGINEAAERLNQALLVLRKIPDSKILR